MAKKRKEKRRKKLPPKVQQALEKARAFSQATYEARRPLGSTSAYTTRSNRETNLHSHVVASMLVCACVHGGVAARALVAVEMPKAVRQQTRVRDAHAGELDSFIIGAGVVSSDLKQQVRKPLPLTLTLYPKHYPNRNPYRNPVQLIDFAKNAQRDDTIVREGGCGPGYVHLHETNYPSSRRVTMGACYRPLNDGHEERAVLAGYSQSYCPAGCAAPRPTPLPLPLPLPPRPRRRPAQSTPSPPQAHIHAAHAAVHRKDRRGLVARSVPQAAAAMPRAPAEYVRAADVQSPARRFHGLPHGRTPNILWAEDCAGVSRVAPRRARAPSGVAPRRARAPSGSPSAHACPPPPRLGGPSARAAAHAAWPFGRYRPQPQ